MKRNKNRIPNVKRLNAIDGSQHIFESFKNSYLINIPSCSGKKAIGGNLGTFISHMKAWEMVRQHSDTFNIICEDDVIFSSNSFPKIKNLVGKLPSNWHWLNVFHPYKISVKEKYDKTMYIPNPEKGQGYNTGLVCYCLSKEGSELLLSLVKPLDVQEALQYNQTVLKIKQSNGISPDHYLKKYWNQLHIFFTYRNMVSHDWNVVSDRRKRF